MNAIAMLKEEARAKRVRVCTHSGKVGPGDIFVSVPSASKEAHNEECVRYCIDAVEKDAGGLVCLPLVAANPELRAALLQKGSQTIVLETESPATVLGELCAAQFDTDILPFPLVAVTGTNGKTTISYLLEYFWRENGLRTGVMGTISYRWPGHCEDAPLTTPDCLWLHGMLAQMKESQVEAAVMECSSHALAQNRVAGIPFSAALFTNLTQDHLDYHGTMEAYYEAKAKLFLEQPKLDKSVAINADDRYGRKLLTAMAENGGTPVGYGLDPANAVPGTRHLYGTVRSCTTQGLHLEMMFEGRVWQIESPLVGVFNASNLLAVQAYLLQSGFEPESFACLEGFHGVSGRLERIRNNKGLDVFVDYAHTPDALTKTLSALREVGFSRVVTVFGCGGNRDRTKRPKMARAAAALSEVVVLTSDNPRKEEPLAIMADARLGFEGAPCGVEIREEADRKKAIALAVSLMRPGDALVVAGKGHESYQIIGETKYSFSDQETLREILSCQ